MNINTLIVSISATDDGRGTPAEVLGRLVTSLNAGLEGIGGMPHGAKLVVKEHDGGFVSLTARFDHRYAKK